MKVSELKQDSRNTNAGTKRGRQMVADSLKEYGAARSVVVDKNGVLIAGNKTAEACLAAGIDDAIVIETTGDKLVVVQRTDLDLATDRKAKELGIADNRASEIGLEWDAANLQTLNPEVDLQKFFSEKELKSLFNEPDDASEALPEGYGVMITEISEQQQLDLLERLASEGFTVKAMVF
jgi:ParB-like chromosome segregation protein Spo0J